MGILDSVFSGSALSRAICSTDWPLESIRLMIAIDGDMVPRATKTRSIALDSAKDAHLLMKNSTSAFTENAIAGFSDQAVSTSLKPDARIGHSTGGGAAQIGALPSGILK
jgi:hypothetical protein